MITQEQKDIKALSDKLDNFLDVYYREHFIDRDVFRNPVTFQNNVGFFNTNPVKQQATIADPSGGTTIDVEARTAINALIDTLQAFGLIA